MLAGGPALRVRRTSRPAFAMLLCCAANQLRAADYPGFAVPPMEWFQHFLKLPPCARGFHLITPRVVEALPELARIRIGLLHVFIEHTSASLTINENADPDVPADLESAID